MANISHELLSNAELIAFVRQNKVVEVEAKDYTNALLARLSFTLADRLEQAENQFGAADK